MAGNEAFTKFRLLSLGSAGILVLWVLFNADLTKTELVGGLGVDDQQVLGWVLALLLLFFLSADILESGFPASTKDVMLVSFCWAFGLLAVLLALPRLVESTPLESVSSADVLVPLTSACLSIFLTYHLRFLIEAVRIGYKFRRRNFAGLVARCMAASVLLALVIIGLIYLWSSSTPIELIFRLALFCAIYFIGLIAATPRGPIYSPEQIEQLSLINDELERGVEISQWAKKLQLSGPPPASSPGRVARNLQRRQDQRVGKGEFPRFEMLKEIEFKIQGAHFIPQTESQDDNEEVLRVKIIDKSTGVATSEEVVRFRFVREACAILRAPSKLPGDIRNILTPIALKAFQLQLESALEPQDILFKFAQSDEDFESLKELINSTSVNVNHRHDDGWTALMIASANGQEKAVRYLLQKAADPNIRNKLGATALLFASTYGYRAIVRQLLKYHADPDLTDNDGVTPLMRAAKFGHGAVVKLLVEKGAKIDLVDRAGSSAIDNAVESSHGDIARYLRDRLNSG